VTAGAPTVTDSGHKDRSPRCSTQRSEGATSEEVGTGHEPLGEGHGANPKARIGPPRARHSRPKPEENRDRAPSGRDGKPSPTSPHPASAGPEEPPSRGETHEGTRGVELVTNHAQARRVVVSPSASLRPDSPEKASRRIATSPSDVTPSWGSAIRNRRARPTTVRSSQIVSPRQAARPFGGRSRDRKRSGADEAAAFPRAAASDAARTLSRPEAATENRVHERTCRDHISWSTQQTHPPGGDDRIRPKAGVRRLAAGIEDTFPRFGAFRRNQMGRSLHAGLPPQRLPLSGFLTLSAV
jgi:hypothetical protein